jgi:hypothetical protein
MRGRLAWRTTHAPLSHAIVRFSGATSVPCQRSRPRRGPRVFNHVGELSAIEPRRRFPWDHTQPEGAGARPDHRGMEAPGSL